MEDYEEELYSAYMTWEDSRYPTLVIKNQGNYIGFSFNPDTEELRRVCVCHAYSSSECCCGAWDIDVEDL